MKNIFGGVMVLLFATLVASCRSEEEKLEDAMQQAVAWLWHQQGEDGGWHSETHAVLQDGKALSPYILYHLAVLPEDIYKQPEGGVERGISFIRNELKAVMSMSPDSLTLVNYPNYSAAYALRVLCYLDEDTLLQQILADYLLREQFTEHRGFTTDHLAYGGWGYGEHGLPFGQHGHVDISHTRRIAEALESFGIEEDKVFSSLTKVIFFLRGVQREREDPRLYEGCVSRKELPYDGGFISSAVTLATNKSQPVFMDDAGYYYPSYATATCDGLMTLHALGMTATQSYKEAVQWLEQHQDMTTIEGLSADDPEQWNRVMHYYHLAVRAEAMTVAGISGHWPHVIARMLIREQTDKGYYVNPMGGVNKEDDPLMATMLAVQAGYRLVLD